MKNNKNYLEVSKIFVIFVLWEFFEILVIFETALWWNQLDTRDLKSLEHCARAGATPVKATNDEFETIKNLDIYMVEMKVKKEISV